MKPSASTLRRSPLRQSTTLRRETDIECGSDRLPGGPCTGRLVYGRQSCTAGCGMACTVFHVGYSCPFCGWRGEKPPQKPGGLVSRQGVLASRGWEMREEKEEKGEQADD
jgi:hypothetical protein